MEIPSAVIAFTIILGIAYWINSSREEKAATEATEKAIKAARDELEQARDEAQEAIQTRAEKFDIHFSAEELDWICDEVEAEAGREGLLQVIERYSKLMTIQRPKMLKQMILNKMTLRKALVLARPVTLTNNPYQVVALLPLQSHTTLANASL